MMEEKNDVDKIDDVMLPGFRFHPTDEELVGFYLKRKIQQRSLPIELIKQVDIYKYDPWDLPKLATTGEKEWYFYCPRDRKYRNSARPNRVTRAGFWKATGTDRPIYSSDGSKCIGLKKSLVFYRGRAAKGIKTDWMMHEFRLPSLAEPSPPKKLLERSLPPNDAWAICRIFKKTNSMAQRALNYSWISQLPEATASDVVNQGTHCTQFSSENISCTTESVFQICSNNLQQASSGNFRALDISSYKSITTTVDKPSLFPSSNGDLTNSFLFSSIEMSAPTKCPVDDSSMLLNSALIGNVSKTSESIDYEGSQHQFNGFSISLPQVTQDHMAADEDEACLRKNPSGVHENSQWETMRSIGFPFSLTSNLPDAWKSNLPWDSPPCPSEMSSTYSTNKCYT
ncbi:protein FEZ [Manihot esculenta]|uniref:NAC domain-containing protein n=1 Tax=Manihot esculenta TaxID=3983 RepID=A0A2C9WJ80_MANES|nr:protein FEZ [Manihot esculenta]OAY60160.1 hypothetical protein MANES_01G090300v8 [Manihot esculenta]